MSVLNVMINLPGVVEEMSPSQWHQTNSQGTTKVSWIHPLETTITVINGIRSFRSC